MNKRIYMDYHATTPVDPRVLDKMLPYFSERFGNAASRIHSFGWEAEEAVEKARGQVAAAINASPKEIIFTSGATESNNLAIKGFCRKNRNKGRHVITFATEHKAVLDCCEKLVGEGFETTYLPVDREGLLDPAALEGAIREDTILISVMTANNEIGVIQPLKAIGEIAKRREVILHTDAAQAAGKIPLDVQELGVDMLSVSGHKFYAPKGIGALYVRRRNPRVRLESIIDGGGHERGLRSGTLNVPGIVAMGEALEIAVREMQSESQQLMELREKLLGGILGSIEGCHVNGSLEHRLPNNLNLSFEGCDGESLLMKLDDIAVSSGSACTTADPEPSHVLKAIGVDSTLAHASLRFGLGRFTTEEEVQYVVRRLIETVQSLRGQSAVSHA